MKALNKAVSAIGILVFLAALWFLHRAFEGVSLRDIRGALQTVPPARLTAACLLAVANYLVLSLNDALALRYNAARVPYPKVLLASFVGNAISFNLGLSGLSGASIRYRLYSSFGLTALQIAGVVAFCQLSVVLGVCTLSGSAFLLEPFSVIGSVFHMRSIRWFLGWVFLAVPAMALGFSLSGFSLRFRGHDVSLPGGRFLCAQLFISCADLILASSVLYFLLPDGQMGFMLFCGAYVLSVLAGALSQVPGGFGVLDVSLVLLLSPFFPKPELLGAVFLFRLVYYIVPLIIASILLAFIELSDTLDRCFRGLVRLFPTAVSLWVFIAGALLLFSGALPPLHGRLLLLRNFVSLPFLETSNFLNSLLGTALLFLSWGLARRLHSAWAAGIGVLGASALVCLADGLRYEEAVLSLFLLAVLWSCRRHFYRFSYYAVPHEDLALREKDGRSLASNLGWTASIFIVLLMTVWLGLFAYRHVEYSSQMWWEFAFSKSAPRFLRASLGMCVLSVGLYLLMWLRPTPIRVRLSADDVAVTRLVALSRASDSALAYLGDKYFFFSQDIQTGIMFAPSGGFWVSMGDPIGRVEGAADLIWQFCEEADRRGAKAVFYEVSAAWLDVYRDTGLHVSPLGERGEVSLTELPDTLEGGKWKDFRGIRRHLQEQGAVFKVLEGIDRDAVLPRLRVISDEWLALKGGHEKGFSLGFFDEAYLKHFPIAVVELQGDIEAFCNFWAGGTGEILAVDLMRYSHKAPRDIMSYLFTESMLWGKARGFQVFDLGMAPLSGMEEGYSLWERGASILYRHGEGLYHFKGLRAYKEKFHPSWKPFYLAYPEVVDLPLILPQLVYLISRRKHSPVAGETAAASV